MSLAVLMGIYYDFIPEERPPVSVDPRGRLLPDEVYCHIRSPLLASLDQRRYQSQLLNSPERKRKDIWWIAPNGENVVQAVDDIVRSFLTRGVDWFNSHTVLTNAFAEIERGHDCYIKFYQAAYFAQFLGDERKSQEYFKRLDQERERIARL